MAKNIPGSRPRFAVLLSAKTTLQETFKAIRQNRLQSLTPLILMLLLLAGMLGLLSLVPAISPFVYPLF